MYLLRGGLTTTTTTICIRRSLRFGKQFPEHCVNLFQSRHTENSLGDIVQPCPFTLRLRWLHFARDDLLHLEVQVALCESETYFTPAKI